MEKIKSKSNKLKIIFLISVILVATFFIISYNKYSEEVIKEKEVIEGNIVAKIEEQYGKVTEVRVEGPDRSIRNPLTDVNPRRSFLNASNDELAYIDHEGNIQGIGNLTFTTGGSGYGFFDYLGSAATRITKGFFTNIEVSGTVNTSYINTTNIQSSDWTNTTITESQVTDLDKYTVAELDTNFSLYILNNTDAGYIGIFETLETTKSSIGSNEVNLSGVVFVNSTSGSVGIGTTSPTHELNVAGFINVTSFGAATGTDVCQNGGLLSACSSSRVWKENIDNLTISDNMWSKYLQLNPVTFNYINNTQSKIGLIAEEVIGLFPRFVYNTSLPIFTYVNLTREVERVNETVVEEVIYEETEAINGTTNETYIIYSNYTNYTTEYTHYNTTEDYTYKNHSSDLVTPSVDYDDIASANILFIQDLQNRLKLMEEETCSRDNTWSWC